MIEFEVGDFMKGIELAMPNDAVYQASAGNVSVTLTSATSSQLKPNATRADVRVLDNRDAGRIDFQEYNPNVAENAQTLRVWLDRRDGTSGVVTVVMTSSVSTFIAGSSFRSVVMFQPDETAVFVDVPLRASVDFATGYFDLTLSNVTGGATLLAGVNSVTVNDVGGVSLPGSPGIDAGYATGGTILLMLQSPGFLGGPQGGLVGYYVEFVFPNATVQRFDVYGQDSLIVTRLRNQTLYRARAAAMNQRGRGSFSSYVTVSTAVASQPGPVTQLVMVDVAGGSTRLGWQAPEDTGGVDIQMYQISFSDPVTGDARVVTTNSSSVTIGGLRAQQTYRFVVEPVVVVTIDGQDSVLLGPGAVIALETLYLTGPQQPPRPRLLRATGGALHFQVLAPVDSGGVPLTIFSVYVAHMSGYDVTYREFLVRAVESDYVSTGVAGNVSMFGLLADSTYFVRASVSSPYVRPSCESAHTYELLYLR